MRRGWRSPFERNIVRRRTRKRREEAEDRRQDLRRSDLREKSESRRLARFFEAGINRSIPSNLPRGCPLSPSLSLPPPLSLFEFDHGM